MEYKDEAVDEADDTCNGPLVKTMRVSADGQFEDFDFDVTGRSRNDMGWKQMVFDFTADGATATIEFESLTASSCGPALDNVTLFVELEEVDVVIEVGQDDTTPYDFTITYTNQDELDTVILDTVPAEWDVTAINGAGVPDNNHTGNVADVGLGCGETRTIGDVDLSRGGKSGKKCRSATKIEWTPVADPSTLLVDIGTRINPGHAKRGIDFFSPTSCGALFLNNGARVFELGAFGEILDPLSPLLQSNRLCIAAVSDINGDGLVPDGTGDEDGDNLDDFAEACQIGTDPCLADTDEDEINDDVDNCPLIANTNQDDTDEDGLGDACDPDIDGDGFANAADNCPLVSNTDQTNADGDGFGAACDPNDNDANNS